MKLTTSQQLKLDTLTYNFLDAQSVPFDWSEGYGETWEIVYPTYENATERELIALRDEYCIDKDDYQDVDKLCELIQEYERENGYHDPVMNYYTDLGYHYNASEISEKFANSCFTVISFTDGSVGLALTGGGMDMSWSMARAFINAGYLPPVYICQLPHMAGEDDSLTIAACNKTLKSLSDKYLMYIDQNNTINKVG